LTAEHLRPLFAFVIVAIAGAVVFGTSFRAQDVVDVIRGGAPSVIAGTPLLHDPLYVVEDGQRLDAAPELEPEVDSSVGTEPSPVGGSVDTAVPSPGVTVPIPTPAAGGVPATGVPDQGAQGGQGDQGGSTNKTPGKSAGGSPPTTSKGQAPGAPGQAGAHGPGAAAPDVDDEGDDDEAEGHGKADDHGDDEAEAHGRGKADDRGDDKGRAEARGHARGHAKGHAKADRAKGHAHGHQQGHANGKAKGHAKADHTKAQGPAKSKKDRARR
jgi:hypothetical protein